MSAAERLGRVADAAAAVRAEVDERDLVYFEKLVALRQAYADLVHENGLEVEAVDTRVDRERWGRRWTRDR